MTAHDPTRLTDRATARVGYQRGPVDGLGIRGQGVAVLRGPDGNVKQRVPFTNLITQVGDQVYAEAGSGVDGTPDIPTGMRLGTGGATAPAKTGAGAAIVTYVTGSEKAFDATFPSSALNGSARRITYETTWDPGDATATGIDEVVITNETPLTDVAGTAANTMSRAILSPVVNKGAGDTLTVTYTHDAEGT